MICITSDLQYISTVKDLFSKKSYKPLTKEYIKHIHEQNRSDTVQHTVAKGVKYPVLVPRLCYSFSLLPGHINKHTFFFVFVNGFISIALYERPQSRGKVRPCTGTEALYRPYGP